MEGQKCRGGPIKNREKLAKGGEIEKHSERKAFSIIFSLARSLVDKFCFKKWLKHLPVIFLIEKSLLTSLEQFSRNLVDSGDDMHMINITEF